MPYILFETETSLDVRAITTFGLNVKPNTKSPIGYFGTGLKMAIAVLLRHEIPIQLRINSRIYEFYTKADEFRGAEFQAVKMRRANTVLPVNWIHTTLPFTTELAKNWTLWQAFRELESNTRDENGTTLQFDHSQNVLSHIDHGIGERTYWIVGPSEEFAQVWQERDKIFLPQALQTWDWGDPTLQIFRQPSNHIYYRGIRVMDLKKPSLFTYNILKTIDLTEDRTIKYEWDVNTTIQTFLARSEDQDLINHLLNATEDHFESTLSWDNSWSEAPSAVFKDTLARRIHATKRGTTPIPRFVAYHHNWSPESSTGLQLLTNKFQEWFDAHKLNMDREEQHLMQQVASAIPRTQVYEPIPSSTKEADDDDIPS